MNNLDNPTEVEIVDGIPHYSPDRYWGKAPQAKLEEALRVLETSGWDAFIVHYGNTFDVTLDENRADWRFVIPLSSDATVLDLGAGMGRISIPLARVVKKVVAVDNSFLRMKFLKLRAVYEELSNIEVAVSDVFDLPFPKASFDLIVMNGVLEWVGATTRYRDPHEAQLASLHMCRELLKPGGYLYIGIENRWALSYLRAYDHSGLRFTSYMPRWLARPYTKLRLGKEYATYTYGKRGYEELLQETGFVDTRFYLPYPGYNLPRLMIPYDNLQALAYAVQSLMKGNGWGRRLARALASLPGVLYCYRYVFFSFGIVVKK